MIVYLFSCQTLMNAVHLHVTSMPDVSMDLVPLTVSANLAFMVMACYALSLQVSSMAL